MSWVRGLQDTRGLYDEARTGGEGDVLLLVLLSEGRRGRRRLCGWIGWVWMWMREQSGYGIREREAVVQQRWDVGGLRQVVQVKRGFGMTTWRRGTSRAIVQGRACARVGERRSERRCMEYRPRWGCSG